MDQNSNPIDPWVGPCNPDISTSLWKNQLPYYNPGILRLITMSGSVPSTNCPDPEQLTIKNHFNPGDYIRFEIQLRDIMQGLPIGITVYDNLGNQILTNIHNYSGTFLVQGYYSDAMILPTTTGTYKMAVSYGGKSAVHYFTVGCPGAYNLTTVHSGKKVTSPAAVLPQHHKSTVHHQTTFGMKQKRTSRPIPVSGQLLDVPLLPE